MGIKETYCQVMKPLQSRIVRLIRMYVRHFQSRRPQRFRSILSTYVANGEVDTEFIPVESEHSSHECLPSEHPAAGARALTATSSCGLAYMWEELYMAASNRLPLALALVNRALSRSDQHQL